jgi:hypothetical protein
VNRSRAATSSSGSSSSERSNTGHSVTTPWIDFHASFHESCRGRRSSERHREPSTTTTEPRAQARTAGGSASPRHLHGSHCPSSNLRSAAPLPARTLPHTPIALRSTPHVEQKRSPGPTARNRRVPACLERQRSAARHVSCSRSFSRDHSFDEVLRRLPSSSGPPPKPILPSAVAGIPFPLQIASSRAEGAGRFFESASRGPSGPSRLGWHITGESWRMDVKGVAEGLVAVALTLTCSPS